MKISLGGFAIEVDADPARAARIRESILYRRLVKPALDRIAERSHQEPTPFGRALVHEPPDLSDPEAASVWEEVSRLRWYHTIELGHGVTTPGFVDERRNVHRFGLPEDMTGMRALDIGTFDGFWAFEMERRGAAEVIGIDLDSLLDFDLAGLSKQRLRDQASSEEVLRERANAYLAEWDVQLPGEGFKHAKRILNSKVERRTLDVYALSPETLGIFDVVFIGELLLHLRDPQTVLENIFSVTRRLAIIAEPFNADLESLDRPLSEFIGMERAGAWWVHSIQSLRKMMMVAGFEPIEEVARFPVANKVGTFSKVVLRGHVPPVGSDEAPPATAVVGADGKVGE